MSAIAGNEQKGTLTVINIHVFFLGSTSSFLHVSWPRGGFLDCLMNPLLAHLGWYSPLVEDLREV